MWHKSYSDWRHNAQTAHICVSYLWLHHYPYDYKTKCSCKPHPSWAHDKDIRGPPMNLWRAEKPLRMFMCLMGQDTLCDQHILSDDTDIPTQHISHTHYTLYTHTHAHAHAHTHFRRHFIVVQIWKINGWAGWKDDSEELLKNGTTTSSLARPDVCFKWKHHVNNQQNSQCHGGDSLHLLWRN